MSRWYTKSMNAIQHQDAENDVTEILREFRDSPQTDDDLAFASGALIELLTDALEAIVDGPSKSDIMDL